MKNIHYISHTHWDREWLRSSDASRVKIVYLVDRMLDVLERNPNYTSFTFDGQSAAMEDYLAIKPYQKKRIQELVRAKRLFLGPWYTQPDMFLASGESLLRNLIIGSRLAHDMGHCMQVGWIPDAFGQIASTPQIFNELGMEAVFIWRGFDYEMINDSVFTWIAPNEDRLLSIHFPLGYGYYRYLPENEKQAVQDIQDSIDKTQNRFIDEQILFMGGSDYAHVLPSLPTTIEKLQAPFRDMGYTLKLSNPEEYVQAVKTSIAKSGRQVQHFKGEARSAVLGRIHAGISSTRIDIKNKMKYYETLLAQVVEPMCVINSYIGGEFTQDIVTYYWKILFKNQFHDSAYSSSPDTVNESAKNRLLNLRHGLQELVWLNLRYLHDQLDFSSLKAQEEVLVLYNTLPYQRNDCVFVSMIVKEKNFVLKDRDNVCIPFVVAKEDIPVSNEIEYYNGILNFHDGGEIQEGSKFRVQLKLRASQVPAMGYQVYKLCYQETSHVRVAGDVHVLDCMTFENSFLHVHIQDNGSLVVTNKKTLTTYKDVHWFEEKGDDGDEYNYSPPNVDTIYTTKTLSPTITCIEENALEVRYCITYELSTPASCVNHERSEDMVTSRIISEVSLLDQRACLDFKTTIENHGKDHMIRVVCKDVHCATSHISQDHFGVIRRNNAIVKQRGIAQGATEEELPIYPMQRYVHLAHQKETFALISRGPCEYEIYNNQEIAITLLRSVGKFGKADLRIRPGRSSGYRLDTPSSQLLECVESSYTLYFDTYQEEAAIARMANMVNVDVQSRHLTNIKREVNQGLAWQASYLSLDEGLELIAMKKSEDGTSQIVRLLNPGMQQVNNKKIYIAQDVKRCYLSTLLEKEQTLLPITDNYILLPEVKKQSFITLKLHIEN